MSRKQFTILAAVLGFGSVLSLPSCGLPQQLDGVSIQPASFTFLDPDPRLSVNFKAYGSFVHPVATKDVTSQVVWTTDANGVVTIDQTGLVTPTGNGCGVVNVLATVTNSPHTPKGQVYIGHATVTVADTSVPSCPQH
jgi:Bacterial Ig-like domain (group 2)